MKPYLSPRRLLSLLARIDKGTTNDCWPWIGKVQSRGRGYMYVNGKHWLVHRLMFALTYDDPGDQVVRHTCDNANCCNPKHMELGTQLDNIADRQKRQRQARGEKHAVARLTEEQVRQIRRDFNLGITPLQLAKEHNVGRRQIYYIIHRQNWKHIE